MATVGNVYQPFDGSTLDTSVWTTSSGIVSVSGGSLLLGGSGIDWGYSYVTTGGYDASRGGVIFEITSVPSATGTNRSFQCFIDGVGGSPGFLFTEQNTINFFGNTPLNGVVYNATNHRFIAVRIENKTAYYYRSADGAEWTLIHSTAVNGTYSVSEIYIDSTDEAGTTTPYGVGLVHGFQGTGIPVAGSWTTPEPVTAPSAPGDIIATPGDGVVTLSWTVPTDTGGVDITDYEIQYGISAESTGGVGTGIAGLPSASSFIPISSGGGAVAARGSSRAAVSTWTTYSDGVSTTTSATIIGILVSEPTLYQFRVRAINSEQNGVWGLSNEITINPPATTEDSVVAQATATGNGTVTTATATKAVAVGTPMLIAVATNNTPVATHPHFTITDTKGNTFTYLGRQYRAATHSGGGIAGTGALTQLYLCEVTTAIEVGDTFTFTSNNPSEVRAFRIQAFPGYSTVLRDAVLTGNSHATAMSARIGYDTSNGYDWATAPQAGDLLFAGIGIETNMTDLAIAYDTDTLNGNWSTGSRIVADSGVSRNSITLATQYKAVSATASQQVWNLGFTTNTSTKDFAYGLVILRPPGATFPVTYIGRGAPGFTTTDGATITPELPPGTAEGDLLLLTVTGFPSTTGGTIGGTTGYTNIENANNQKVYWKVAAAGEAAPVLSPSTHFTTAGVAAHIDVFRGATSATRQFTGGSTAHNATTTALGLSGGNYPPARAGVVAVSLFARRNATTNFTIANPSAAFKQSQFQIANHSGMIALAHRDNQRHGGASAWLDDGLSVAAAYCFVHVIPPA